ncbi:MAG: DUF4249 domain-containing protein [Tannerellaceae bacterium]|jgi:hypothetical protein|nr:DUF4249 domain-containing protein [Tannerellaceae bacterium]
MKNIPFIYFLTPIILLTLLLLPSSCKENIDINTDDAPVRIVIYGAISSDTTAHKVLITRSAGFFSTSKPQAVSHADVHITHASDTIRLNEDAEHPGTYLTAPDVYGIAGETYTLHVTTDFDNSGKKETYEASSFLPHPSRLDSMAVEPSPLAKQFLQVSIWGETPSEGVNYLSLQLYHNGVLFNDSLSGFSTANDEYLAGHIFNGVPAFMLNQERERSKLNPGDTLLLQVSSITHDYATFMENAQWESHGSVPMFGGPPANVPSNIRCTTHPEMQAISGFFTAFSIRRLEMIYY